MTVPHIHKLPAEILQHIFHCCCSSGVLDTRPDPQVQHNTVLLLVQVCSRWRQFLLHAPMFWDEVITSGNPSQLSLASLWLSRAGSLPRSLNITVRGSATPIQSLIARFPFSSISLIIRGDAEKLEFSEIPIESLFPLKILLLENRKSNSPQLSLGDHSFPNLSVVEIHRYFDPFSALVTSKTIEALRIDMPVPISVCSEILRSATNLQKLDLVVDDAERATSIQDVVAPNLTDIILYFQDGYGSGSLISALTAPNLKELRMLTTETLRIILTCDASSFLPKAGQSRMPKLETLSIAKTTCLIDIGILLRSIPSLHTLGLGSKTILDEDTMQGLASGELGPRLQRMYLRDECIPLDPERILTMIESRRGLDIGMRDDPQCARMIFTFAVRYERFRLDEYKQRISDLARSDAIIVQFDFF
ncbi:hypothetical protein F5887DRAFT_1158755, partial [Amanita rubescens]